MFQSQANYMCGTTQGQTKGSEYCEFEKVTSCGLPTLYVLLLQLYPWFQHLTPLRIWVAWQNSLVEGE